MRASIDDLGIRTDFSRSAWSRRPLYVTLSAVVLSLVGAPCALAADNPLKVSVSAGTAYDDDVTISQLDSSTGQSDGLTNFNLTSSYDLVKDKSKTLSVGYTLDQSVHFNLHQYDIRSHGISANGSYSRNGVNFGLIYDFNYVTLGGNNFLKMNFVNPSIMFPVSKYIYIRSHFIYIDENFFHISNHNASHIQPGMQAFYFFNNAKSYLLLSGTYVRENTSGPEFTYHGFTAGLSGSFQINLPKGSLYIKPLYEYTYKNYSNIDPSIGYYRFDRQAEYAITVTYPIYKKLDLNISGHHFERASNFYPADLNQNVVSTSLSYTF